MILEWLMDRIYPSRHFGIVTKRKSTASTISSCSAKNCRQNDLIIDKNRDFLKIRPQNFLEPNDSNTPPLEKTNAKSNKLISSQLSSLARSAAEMLNLFQRIAVHERERDSQHIEQIIRKKQSIPQQSASREFRQGKKLVSIKGSSESSLGYMPSVTIKDDLRSKMAREDTAWTELVLGPRGVLTAIFHILDDRRKLTAKKGGSTTIGRNGSGNSKTTNAYHQSDFSLLPDFLVDAGKLRDYIKVSKSLTEFRAIEGTPSGVRTHEDLRPLELKSNALTTRPSLCLKLFLSSYTHSFSAKPIDFAKVFEAFLTGAKGNFDERIFNLPEILGICNRLSCGDIYKAIDKFRRSEFFINFQTALQLIQDPKGWEILGNLISNPNLIDQFMNGAGATTGGMGNLFRSNNRNRKLSKSNSKEIGPEDGDIGIDFSKMVENVNSGFGGEFTKTKKPTAEELPEIAENIDATDYYNAVESETDIEETETIAKPDMVLIAETVVTMPPTRNKPVIPDLIMPQISESIDQIENTKIIIDATKPTSTKTWRNRQVTTPRRLQRPYFTVTYQPAITTAVHKQTTTPSTRIRTSYPTWTVTTGIRSTPTATTKNFREESDYYAMYYDDIKG
uniref:Uncharacterized protein n=1 Tax=Setaria digitata TaxID=48799 RepID=A0A915PPY6_9BILA